MLATLGYRIPAEHVTDLLGQVTVYPWGDDFAGAWQRLPRTPRRGGAPATPPYRQLLTGLAAVHGQPVRIIDDWQLSDDDRAAGIKGMILTSDAINPFRLTTCLRTFERQLRKGEDLNTLAPALPSADTTRAFRDHITVAESGTATAPGWLFDSATWAIMARVGSRKLALDDNGPYLALRMDTDGSLLAWDDLVSNQWGADYTGYAMLRVTARIITLPRVPDLAVVFDAHLSRINNQWRGSKNAWIERDKPELPVLRVPVKNVPPKTDGGRWTTEAANHAAAIAQACGMERLDLDQDLPPRPGRTRPLVPGPRVHPVGKGPGARLMLRLAEHIARTCPHLEPLEWAKDKHTKVKTPRRQVLTDPKDKGTETTLLVTPDIITGAVAAAGSHRLRLLCLYATSAARHRMATQLAAVASAAATALDDQAVDVHPGLVVSFHRVPELLEHGNRDRVALASDIEVIAKQETGTVVAWVETEYDPKTGKATDDAKNPVRRLLSRLDITAQFLATPPPPTTTDAPRRQPVKTTTATTAKADHPAMAAAADLLLRTTGVLHPDLARDILRDFLDGTGHSSVHLVGLHSRLQHSAVDGTAPKLVITATAIHAHQDPHRFWQVRMWSDTANRWVPQPAGIAHFHAGPIGSAQHGRRGAKAVQTRLHVESILDALPSGPVVIMIDAAALRSIYPGLQNHQFAVGALPAVSLTAQRDVAIVRCNTSREVPRPVHRHGGHQPGDPRQPAAPDRYVYQLASSNVWLFPKSSRIYRAKGGSIGARYTPWTLPDNLRHLLKDDWHAYTGTEIAVPQAGIWSERALVLLTARLCDHTITWDDRTLAPMPLHLAIRADLTHPDYRTDDEETNA
ncbi:RNaseH domain-containing protein [Micromonospora sp. NBRC 110037]|uniref:RNaseH domain-containing protein n=1 Tax=Micromonospora sp. NBRC 110037 TaxID=1621261 RepID=UPI0007DB3037|nr:RNaseH domain-containing protein [Micromonospora sp. NBRC 110037]